MGSNALTSMVSPHLLFAGDLRDGGKLYARMWAPALGIEEDPATGSACAALVGVMASNHDCGGTAYRLSIQQGVSMGRRSEIEAEARKRGSVVTSGCSWRARGVLLIRSDGSSEGSQAEATLAPRKVLRQHDKSRHIGRTCLPSHFRLFGRSSGTESTTACSGFGGTPHVQVVGSTWRRPAPGRSSEPHQRQQDARLRLR